jgi:hypothetical protein
MMTKSLVFAVSTSLLGLAAARLATRYEAEQRLHTRFETKLELESERRTSGGEGGGAMSSSSLLELEEEHVDRVREVEEGRPKLVERSFEKLAGRIEVEAGERSLDIDLETPLSGVVLALERGEAGAVEAKAIEGSAPDGSLDGHVLELALDALLPEGEVEEGATWELSSEAIRRALRVDHAMALYRMPAEEEGGQGAGRGRRRGGSGSGDLRLLAQAEWKGKAKLAALDEEVGGARAAKIELELEAKGEIEDPAPPQGGGRGLALPAALATTYSIELEGSLTFAIEARRPLELTLEGPVTVESVSEREREGRTIRMERTSRGTLSVRATVAKAE